MRLAGIPGFYRETLGIALVHPADENLCDGVQARVKAELPTSAGRASN